MNGYMENLAILNIVVPITVYVDIIFGKVY